MVNTAESVQSEYAALAKKNGVDYAKQCVNGDNRLTDSEKKAVLGKLSKK